MGFGIGRSAFLRPRSSKEQNYALSPVYLLYKASPLVRALRVRDEPLRTRLT